MSSLEEIGAILGFVAFGGLAALAFLIFQQARHVRRLREWAGRAPERAAAAAAREHEHQSEATLPAFGAETPGARKGPGRIERFREEIAVRGEGLRRRIPVDPRILLGGLLAIVLGVGIATSGFGLVGGSDGDPPAPGDRASRPPKVEVAVLNGTAPEGGVGVAGIADRVSRDVRAAGYRIGAVENAGSYPVSVIMFTSGAKSDARDLADELDPLLGETDVMAMTPEVEDLADGAELALVVGQDDQGI